MSAAEIVADLSRLGVKLWVESDQLRFKAPQGVLTPELKTKLIERKGDLLAFLRQVQSSIQSSAAPTIRPVPRQGDLPLSYAQERLWFVDQWEPGSAAYNVYDAIVIQGNIELAGLQKSLNEIIRRHEVLRTTFVVNDGEPAQRIAAELILDVPVISLEDYSGSDRDAELQRLISAETSRPFDLSAGPLMRVALFRLEPDQHVLLFNLHHIVSDGWTTGLLIKELAAFYDAFTTGRPSPLPELQIQYADFAAWQREWMKGERLERERDFWKQQLNGAPTSLDLPTDRPRPHMRSSRGATREMTLSPALSSDVRKLAQQERVTPYVVLLSAWTALLWKHAGQDEVVIGSPHANRNRTELEDLIGFFVNTLVLRADLSGNPTFLNLLARLRDVTISAQAHQDLPFEKMVEELNLERDLSRTPLFQVAFVFQNAPSAEMAVPGLTIRRLKLPTETSKFDLTLAITDSEPSMEGEIEYSTDLFDSATIARIASQFQVLLAAALARPEQRLSRIPILTERERHQLLLQWNATTTEYRRSLCVDELFEQQAERTPDATAIIFNDNHLSYSELNERANQLAHYLRDAGVGPEAPVGICLNRSVEMIVALLGVLKAGGAYVPLDPAYPLERLAVMLDDVKPAVLLTQEALLQLLPPQSGDIFCLDTGWDLISQHSRENLCNQISPQSLAYVMYTSGSTGRPKGVSITHTGIVRLVDGIDYVRLDDTEVMLQLAPISFDASTFEIWGSLLNGGKLVVMPPHAPSLEELAAAITRYGISTLWLTTALFQQFVQAHPESLRGLRQLMAGGEVMPLRQAEMMLEEAPDCRFINFYGPTENTTFTSYYPIERRDCFASAVPIGRPIANTRVYILDKELEPVAVGVRGELFTGGDGLARGYFNQPEITADKFIPDPFSDQPGGRLYRTGDLARYLPEGDIDFQGRIDQQVKIRGFRIEPGEIEATLSQHEGVREAAVIAREDEPGEKRLIGYVVARQERGTNGEELRKYLKRRLPDYMIPTWIVMLEEMPLNANGKIDRRALPLPDKIHPQNQRKYVPARTLVEQLLTGMWADLLKVQQVGIHDNFFDLGGHSLLATQLMSRVNAAFQSSLALREVFEHPTVARLAERIEVEAATGQQQEIPSVKTVSRAQPLPVSFSQENLWLFEQLSPGASTYTTCRAGRVSGRLSATAIEASFNYLLRRHEALRTRFIAIEGRPYQVIKEHKWYEMGIVDLSGLEGEEREAEAERLSNEEAQRAIDITEAPVARARLLRLEAQEHVYVMSIHHIAYDLWSGGVLLEEMEKVYLAYARGEQVEAEELAVEYADFAVWQREWLRGEILDKQFGYWKQRLEGLSATPMEIPTDRPRPLVETMDGASEYFGYPKSLSEGIKSLARRESVTEFMALLAVFQVLLHRYTGQDDVVVGSVISNRNQQELEGVVGFFDNPIVLRVDASGKPTFREFLGRVRDMALGAFANQYVPFELLVRELQPERASNRTPLIQAMFVFLLDRPAMSQEFAGLKVVPYDLHSGKAMFDLLLGMHESDQGLEAELNYNCDLFDATTIIRICEHFEKLLEAAVANPDQRISEMPMLTESERSQLVECNDTEKQYEVSKCLQALFEDQVERTPNSVAIVFEEEQITYRHLNARANQIARYLRRFGVGPELRVGVCLERSANMVAAIVGVLKAGGAYVPMDPNYPKERLSYMLEDAQVSILITAQKLQPIDSKTSVKSIYLDADWEIIAEQSQENPEAAGHPDSLAYVIYTSGSTGQPKGVAIAHRSVVAFLNWAHETFPEDLLGGLLASTSICFDLSIFEMFLPLCFGGRMILAENVLAIPELAARSQITLINTVPSAMKELLNSGGLPASVRTVNLAGEPLSTDLAQRLLSSSHIEWLYNLYGPSETTTYSTFASIAADESSMPTIGVPIANTRVYVLGEGLTPTGVGVPGELFIGGSGLARCYLNRAEPTAENFLPDPFAAVAGARMYRTGDRARWLSNGKLEFMGRLDQQVKVRGYRIELGEIEAALRHHPSVREAVVVSREGKEGDKQLVAYVIARAESQVSSAELRSYLQLTLPKYMLPNAFVELEEFPLTPSGKLDRKALPAPEAARTNEGPIYLTARDDIEFQMLRVWEQLLGVSGIGIRDSFFDLGGYSLLGIRLMSEIERQFGRRLPLGLLLENPTIERLASLLRQEARAPERSALVPISPAGSGSPFFCVHPVGGNVLCYRDLALRLGPQHQVYGFQLPESTKDGQFATIEAMASHYLEHLRRVQPQGPYRLGGWSMGGVIALEMARSLVEQGQRVQLLALIDSFAEQPVPAPEHIDDHLLLEMFAEDIEGLCGKSLDFSVESLRQRDVAEALELLLNRLRLLDVMPTEFGRQELDDLFKLYRASLSALLDYKPRAYPGHITLLKARMSASDGNGDLANGWSRFALGGLDVHEIEADHYSIMSGEPLQVVADLLRAKLGEDGLTAGSR